MRIAQRMGLASDGTNYGLLPFEAEIRRRLWWQIVLIDTRASEISGAGLSLVSYPWNTKLPSNLNDSDLFPGMRASPVERSGLTEMVFIRLRCEMAGFGQKLRDLGATESTSMRNKAIDEFEQRIESEYLVHCDSSIPLHFISLLMAKQAICKLRIGLDLFRAISLRNFDPPLQENAKVFKIA